ncbi:MAG: iron-containing alcohol dehydrogenase [Candidatus Aenigmarchaeota archaeon]|nr:iron-containing alcohol dehydrogenase [Candidatus Aenigmarchaeota archaeon]
MSQIKPPKIIIKKGAVDEIPNLLTGLGNFNSLLIVTGKTTHELIGRKIADALTKEGYKINVANVEECDESTVERIKKESQGLKPGLIIGIGGGKNIDVAKAVSYELEIPCFSVPTIPSHDGIASDRAVISKGKKKYPVVGKLPIAIVADIEILSKAPFRLFAAGCGDVIAKRTAVLDWQLSRNETGEKYDDFSAKLASSAADTIINNSKQYEKHYKSSVELLIKALISCGIAMATAKSSRPCSGSEHMFCHAINFLYPENKALHGEKVALGTYIMAFLHNIDYDEIKEALLSYKLPVNHEQIQVQPEILVKALSTAHEIRSDRRLTILRDGIKTEEAENILKKLEVI